jgi:hypothetical protein
MIVPSSLFARMVIDERPASGYFVSSQPPANGATDLGRLKRFSRGSANGGYRAHTRCQGQPVRTAESGREGVNRCASIGRRNAIPAPHCSEIVSAESAVGGWQRMKIRRASERACARSQSARQQHGTPVSSAFLFPRGGGYGRRWQRGGRVTSPLTERRRNPQDLLSS